MTSKQQTTGENSELSLNLNASFTLCQTKRLKFGSKSQGSPIFGRFFLNIILTHFFNGFFSLSFRSLPEATLLERRAKATTTSTWRPRTATSRRCGTSSAWLRSACTRKVRLAGGLKEWLNCLFRWCCGWKVPEEIQHSQVWCQQKS